MVIQLIKGDCLEEMKNIPDGSVDLILTDPPYGTIKGLGGDIPKYKHLSNSTWDVILDNKEMFKECKRVLRKNGKLILFSQEPYTSKLIVESNGDLPFAYRLVWLKDHFANCLVVNKAPVSYFEDILVFVKNFESENNDDNPCKEYAIKVFKFINKSMKELREFYGNTNLSHFNSNGKQFRLCAKETYNNLIRDFNLRAMEGFLEYGVLKEMNKNYKNTFKSVFNLSEGQKIKSNVLQYKKDYGGLHPTQKPVELLKDLIKTYSNEGDTILDFTMGSGSTGVACVNTNRKFIGIELDEKYFKIAEERINKIGEQTKLD